MDVYKKANEETQKIADPELSVCISEITVPNSTTRWDKVGKPSSDADTLISTSSSWVLHYFDMSYKFGKSIANAMRGGAEILAGPEILAGASQVPLISCDVEEEGKRGNTKIVSTSLTSYIPENMKHEDPPPLEEGAHDYGDAFTR
jgi:hypothetical protein